MEQTPEPEQVFLATALGQGRILFAKAAEPAEQMGIAGQLGEVEQLREIRLEIGEEVTRNAAIALRGAGSESGRESLDTGVKNVTEQELGQLVAPRVGREILGKDQPWL